MKFLKTFNNEYLRQSYLNKKWTSPHVFVNREDKSLDYEQKYIPLQYIRSTQTGGQYIDLGTGLFDTSPINMRIDLNWMVYGHGKTGTTQSTMFCAAREISPYPGLNIRINNDNNLTLNYRLKEAQINPVTNTLYDWCWGDGKGAYYVKIYGVDGTLYYAQGHLPSANNVLLHCENEFNFSDGQLHNVTTSLFCSKDSNGNPWRFINARLDYLKLYKNHIMIHDLIPVKTLQGVPGLYDKAHKKFYRSQGDEDFVSGPIIS